MDSNDELKEIDLKIVRVIIISKTIKIENFNLGNILIDQKSYENILVYNISDKNLIPKPLRIRIDKIDGIE